MKRFTALALALILIVLAVPFAAAAEGYSFTGAQIVLGEDISLIYYSDVPYSSTLTMKASINGRTEKVAASDYNGLASFRFNGIAPDELADNISVVVYDNGKEIGLAKEEYSIKEACIALLKANLTGAGYGYSEAQAQANYALVSDLLQYGNKASTYNKGEAIPYDDVTSALGSNASRFAPHALTAHTGTATTAPVADGFRVTGLSVYFDTQNKFYVRFATTRALNNIRFAVKSVGSKEYAKFTADGDNYYFYTDPITAVDMTNNYTFTVYDGSEKLLAFDYSIEQYAIDLNARASGSAAHELAESLLYYAYAGDRVSGKIRFNLDGETLYGFQGTTLEEWSNSRWAAAYDDDLNDLYLTVPMSTVISDSASYMSIPVRFDGYYVLRINVKDHENYPDGEYYASLKLYPQGSAAVSLAPAVPDPTIDPIFALPQATGLAGLGLHTFNNVSGRLNGGFTVGHKALYNANFDKPILTSGNKATELTIPLDVISLYISEEDDCVVSATTATFVQDSTYKEPVANHEYTYFEIDSGFSGTTTFVNESGDWTIRNSDGSQYIPHDYLTASNDIHQRYYLPPDTSAVFSADGRIGLFTQNDEGTTSNFYFISESLYWTDFPLELNVPYVCETAHRDDLPDMRDGAVSVIFKSNGQIEFEQRGKGNDEYAAFTGVDALGLRPYYVNGSDNTMGVPFYTIGKDVYMLGMDQPVFAASDDGNSFTITPAGSQFATGNDFWLGNSFTKMDDYRAHEPLRNVKYYGVNRDGRVWVDGGGYLYIDGNDIAHGDMLGLGTFDIPLSYLTRTEDGYCLDANNWNAIFSYNGKLGYSCVGELEQEHSNYWSYWATTKLHEGGYYVAKITYSSGEERYVSLRLDDRGKAYISQDIWEMYAGAETSPSGLGISEEQLPIYYGGNGVTAIVSPEFALDISEDGNSFVVPLEAVQSFNSDIIAITTAEFVANENLHQLEYGSVYEFYTSSDNSLIGSQISMDASGNISIRTDEYGDLNIPAETRVESDEHTYMYVVPDLDNATITIDVSYDGARTRTTFNGITALTAKEGTVTIPEVTDVFQINGIYAGHALFVDPDLFGDGYACIAAENDGLHYYATPGPSSYLGLMETEVIPYSAIEIKHNGNWISLYAKTDLTAFWRSFSAGDPIGVGGLDSNGKLDGLDHPYNIDLCFVGDGEYPNPEITLPFIPYTYTQPDNHNYTFEGDPNTTLSFPDGDYPVNISYSKSSGQISIEKNDCVYIGNITAIEGRKVYATIEGRHFRILESFDGKGITVREREWLDENTTGNVDEEMELDNYAGTYWFSSFALSSDVSYETPVLRDGWYRNLGINVYAEVAGNTIVGLYYKDDSDELISAIYNPYVALDDAHIAINLYGSNLHDVFGITTDDPSIDLYGRNGLLSWYDTTMS